MQHNSYMRTRHVIMQERWAVWRLLPSASDLIHYYSWNYGSNSQKKGHSVLWAENHIDLFLCNSNSRHSLRSYHISLKKENNKVPAWLVVKSLLRCFIPLPWQTRLALRQISQRADLVTLGCSGRLTQSWALWSLVCRAPGCLFQQRRQQAWFALMEMIVFS